MWSAGPGRCLIVIQVLFSVADSVEPFFLSKSFFVGAFNKKEIVKAGSKARINLSPHLTLRLRTIKHPH
jgi:hypothetical protein